MRKLLAATTSLALIGTGALAEYTISGAAELGLDYDSGKADNVSKHTFAHDMGVKVSASTTTAGGLEVGGSAGFDSKTGGGSNDTGTVYISGSWGKLTIGDNDSADLAAGGIDDVGMNGIGVDDWAEGLRGAASSIRYDNSFGQVDVAISAGSKVTEYQVSGNALIAVSSADRDDVYLAYKVEPKAEENEFAVGMKFNAGSMSFGVGYASRAGDVNTPSLAVGYGSGAISGSLFWSSNSLAVVVPQVPGFVTSRPGYTVGADDPNTWYDESKAADGVTPGIAGEMVGFDPGSDVVRATDFTIEPTTIGMDLSYVIGNSTLTLSYARADLNLPVLIIGEAADTALQAADTGGTRDNMLSPTEVASIPATAITPSKIGSQDVTHSAFGVGVVHDLGGGASLNAGFGSVPDIETDSDWYNPMKKNQASVGVTFSF